MVDPVLIARARKARYDDLPNFSGHSSEDAERFLKSVKNMTKANDNSTDQQFLEIVRGKLTQTAGSWFDDHESQFAKWSDFETAFRNRYFSTTMINAKFDKLSQRKQSFDESVTAYYDEITTLCREIDPKMPETIIIQHLMKGINPEFRKELTRRQSSMTTLAEFLQLAKLEQDIHDASTQFQESIALPEPLSTYHLASNINQKASYNKPKYPERYRNHYSHLTMDQSSKGNWNSYSNMPYRQSTHVQNRNKDEGVQSTRFQRMRYQSYACKVCGQENHRSIDCKHKRLSGCYNCGQRHSVRDCRNPPHFQ